MLLQGVAGYAGSGFAAPSNHAGPPKGPEHWGSHMCTNANHSGKYLDGVDCKT